MRPMRLGDVPDVYGIECEAYRFPWSLGIFRDCLRIGYGCWVLEAEDEIRGYAVLSAAAGEAHVLNICVAPGYQRRGYGRALLRHLIGLAREYGASQLFLEVRPSNVPAILLYQEEGFTQVGRRTGYYPNAHDEPREDALILRLAL